MNDDLNWHFYGEHWDRFSQHSGLKKRLVFVIKPTSEGRFSVWDSHHDLLGGEHPNPFPTLDAAKAYCDYADKRYVDILEIEKKSAKVLAFLRLLAEGRYTMDRSQIAIEASKLLGLPF